MISAHSLLLIYYHGIDPKQLKIEQTSLLFQKVTVEFYFVVTLQIRFLIMRATLCNTYFVPLEFPVNGS